MSLLNIFIKNNTLENFKYLNKFFKEPIKSGLDLSRP